VSLCEEVSVVFKIEVIVKNVQSSVLDILLLQIVQILHQVFWSVCFWFHAGRMRGVFISLSEDFRDLCREYVKASSILLSIWRSLLNLRHWEKKSCGNS